jgi:proteasome accessory factor A
MQKQEVTENLVGVESEVHVFPRSKTDSHLGAKAACMLLGILKKLFGCKGGAGVKTCPHTGIPCGGHEFLLNGSRAYWDHGYLEYATPACSRTSDAVTAVLAGDLMIKKACNELQHTLAKPVLVAAVRNNIDHRGHSFGAHVNVRMTRQGYERAIEDPAVLHGFVIPFFVTLPVICGSGRCSSEEGEDLFQTWQRSDFLRQLIGLQTTYDRPLINTRDEPLSAEPGRYARFHIIAFDANRMEVAEYLKLGLLRLLCAAIDAGRIALTTELAEPLAAIRVISREPFDQLRLKSQKNTTALGIQRAYFAAFTKLYEQDVFVDRVPDAGEILVRWNHILTKLEQDPFSLVGTLDWITKYAWLEQIRSTQELKWSSPQMKWLDIQYHCLNSSYLDIPCERITEDQQITALTDQAPKNSRASIRSELLRAFINEVASVDWHYLVSSGRENGYLLPDSPGHTLAGAFRGAKSLEEAARLLGLMAIALEDSQQLWGLRATTSNSPEQEIRTV